MISKQKILSKNIRKPSIIAKLSILIVIIVVPVFSYIIFDVSAGQIINKMLNRGSLTDGLVGHWTFDGKDMINNVADVSGNGNTGYLNGQTSTTTMIGKIGQALDFDGVDDYVNYGDLQAFFTDELSVSFWVNRSLDIRSLPLMGQMSTGWGYDWMWYLSSTGQLMFYVYTSSGIQSAVIGSISNNQWYHFTATYDASQIKVYKNGVLIDSVSQTGSIRSVYLNTILGVGNGKYFAGIVDDVRIYNRALSADEISRLYHLGATAKINKTLKPATSPLEDGLVGHWTFDGKDMINNVADVSGNGNTGYLNGQTSTTTMIGKIGQALDFDGVDDYVSTNYFPTGSIHTLSYWVNFDVIGDPDSLLIGTHDGNNNRLYLGLSNNDSLFAGLGDSWTDTVASGVSVGKWYMFTLVGDGSVARVYLDGVEKTSFTYSFAGTSSLDFWIGKRNNTYQAPINGKIDDVRIYNRALSADEISRLYHLGATAKINKTLKPATSPLEDGLVGHWTFDGKDMINNVADVSGNGNTGYLNGQTSTTTMIGKIGQALDFDGVDDYVAIQSLGMSFSKLTISAWVKLNTESIDHQMILSTGPTNYFYLDIVNRSVFFRAINLASDSTPGTTILEKDVWYHVLVTYDGSSVRLYLNGIQDADEASSGTIAESVGQEFRIGLFYDDSLGFNGTIDDVRIYNRALSADEIKQLYNLGR